MDLKKNIKKYKLFLPIIYLKRRVTKLLRKYKFNKKVAKYKKYSDNHMFNVRVGDTTFKMTFANYDYNVGIIERIEGRREPETTAIIKSLLMKGDNVLEIGGCYGYFTLIMSKCVGDSGKVVSIEGTPNNYYILEKNLLLNKTSNVSVYNKFVTSNKEDVTYDSSETHPYHAIKRLYPDYSKNVDGFVNEVANDKRIKVDTIIISEFLTKISYKPKFIFMDIEGFEVEVFQDLSNKYLTLNKPIIVFETHEGLYKNNYGLDYVKKILIANDYFYREIGGNFLCIPQSS